MGKRRTAEHERRDGLVQSAVSFLTLKGGCCCKQLGKKVIDEGWNTKYHIYSDQSTQDFLAKLITNLGKKKKI